MQASRESLYQGGGGVKKGFWNELVRNQYPFKSFPQTKFIIFFSIKQDVLTVNHPFIQNMMEILHQSFPKN